MDMKHTKSEYWTKTFSGISVPSLGFGTYQLEGDTCRRAVREALEAGYRHVDTARMYGNEKEVGQALRDSRLPRDEIFLTSKIWMEHLRPQDFLRETENALEDLQTDALDLLLIHWPNPDVPLDETMDALNRAVEKGWARRGGVSNFPTDLLENARRLGSVFCDQVEYHPLLSQETLLTACRRNGIMLTAYSPLGQGAVLKNQVIRDIAAARGKTPAQIGLRWLIEQENVVAIPRSSSTEHLQANLDIFDFSLTPGERDALNALPKNQRQIQPPFAPAWDPC